MSDIKGPNRHAPFDNNIESALGHYVYALFDPCSRKPFYVGKGGGKHGNDRVLHHFIEARDDKRKGFIPKAVARELSKIKKIQEIWDQGREVDWKVMRRNLRDEAEALTVEAALIDAFKACGYQLLNVQGGHNAELQGLVESNRLYENAAPPILGRDFPTELLNRPLFIFNIGNAVGKMWEDIDRVAKPEFIPDYRKATICCWKVGEHWRALSNGVAIGVVGGISRTAFVISGWERAQGDSSRWQIVPLELEEDTRQAVLNRKFTTFLEPVKGYLQRGGFIICEVSETGARTFRRGSKNRHPDAPPAEHRSLP